MKFSKAHIIIKYNIANEYSSIYAHIFEHIFVSAIEGDDWFVKKGAMVFGATNFDYIDIQIDMLKTSTKLIYDKIKTNLYNIKDFKKCFDAEKTILLRESKLYECADDEKLLLKMLNKSLKTSTLSVQGSYDAILQISYDKFLSFVNLNILPNQVIINIDGKDFVQGKYQQKDIAKFEISSCRIKRTEDVCTIELIIPDVSFGKDKLKMELLEYLNFSENNGLYKILRTKLGLLYSIEHAYVFIQGLYMLIVEIKCEKEVIERVKQEIDEYIKNNLFFKCNIDAILNYLFVLKHNEYLGSEKQAHNLYHKLIRHKKITLKDELKSLSCITEAEFKNFLKNQVVYCGIAY